MWPQILYKFLQLSTSFNNFAAILTTILGNIDSLGRETGVRSNDRWNAKEYLIWVVCNTMLHFFHAVTKMIKNGDGTHHQDHECIIIMYWEIFCLCSGFVNRRRLSLSRDLGEVQRHPLQSEAMFREVRTFWPRWNFFDWTFQGFI